MAPVSRRRPKPRRPSKHILPSPGTNQGGHLLAANRARGLSPRQDLVNRAAIFETMPKKHPAADRPQIVQGTRGGKPK